MRMDPNAIWEPLGGKAEGRHLHRAEWRGAWCAAEEGVNQSRRRGLPAIIPYWLHFSPARTLPRRGSFHLQSRRG